MGGAVGLILHSCDSTESLTQRGPSFNNSTPLLLPRFAEKATGRVRFGYTEGWEVLGPGSPAKTVERRQRKQVGELTDSMPDRWSLPQRFVMECRTLEEGNKPR